MKYIMLKVEQGEIDRELPIIFPDLFVHEDVFKALVRNTSPDSNLIITGVASAGFINSADIKSKCYGESTTLKKKSRGQTDDDRIKMLDYFHGIVM